MRRRARGIEVGRNRDAHRGIEREHVADLVDDEGEVLALVLDADGQRVLQVLGRDAETTAQADGGDDLAAQIDEADDVDGAHRNRRHRA